MAAKSEAPLVVLPPSASLETLLRSLVRARDSIEELDSAVLELVRFRRDLPGYGKGATQTRRHMALSMGRTRCVEISARVHALIRAVWRNYHEYRPVDASTGDPQPRVPDHVVQKEEIMLAEHIKQLGNLYHSCVDRLGEVLAVLETELAPSATSAHSAAANSFAALPRGAEKVYRLREPAMPMTTTVASVPSGLSAVSSRRNSTGDCASPHDSPRTEVTASMLPHDTNSTVCKNIERDVSVMLRLFRELSEISSVQADQLDAVDALQRQSRLAVGDGRDTLSEAVWYRSGSMALTGGAIGALIGGPIGAVAGAKSAAVSIATAAGIAAVAGGLTGAMAARILSWRMMPEVGAAAACTVEDLALLSKLE